MDVEVSGAPEPAVDSALAPAAEPPPLDAEPPPACLWAAACRGPGVPLPLSPPPDQSASHTPPASNTQTPPGAGSSHRGRRRAGSNSNDGGRPCAGGSASCATGGVIGSVGANLACRASAARSGSAASRSRTNAPAVCCLLAGLGSIPCANTLANLGGACGHASTTSGEGRS